MSAPGSLTWFAQHESRLVWRDVLSMRAANGTARGRRLCIWLSVLLIIVTVVEFFVEVRAHTDALLGRPWSVRVSERICSD